MSAAGEFVDATLQYESSWQRAEADRARLGGGSGSEHGGEQGSGVGSGVGGGLTFYGASVGAIRGTIRDAGRRYPGLGHDDITALSSELWAAPVFERRLAAIVLLQTHLRMLRASDLTRIEGFLRQAGLPALIDPLATDVVAPLILGMAAADRARATAVVDRWAAEPGAGLRRAAGLVQALLAP